MVQWLLGSLRQTLRIGLVLALPFIGSMATPTSSREPERFSHIESKPEAQAKTAGPAPSLALQASIEPAQQVLHSSGPLSTSQTAVRQRYRRLSALGVARWHQQGVCGGNVKIAVLDSGFYGYHKFLGTVLPAKVESASFRQDKNLEAGDSRHGILCAEVIHALSPESELLFANWEPNQPEAFLKAIRWAKQQGAKILSCSLIMPSWSDGEGGGIVNQAIAKIVGTGDQSKDMLFFASAGNTAERHWGGSFRGDGTGCHLWAPDETNSILEPWGEDRVAVELYGKGVGNYQLSIRDASTNETTGMQQIRCYGDQTGKINCLIVKFMPVRGRNYQLQVRRKQEPATAVSDKFHLVVLGADLSHSRFKSSIPCPADCPVAQAVGAVGRKGARYSYSACGPNSKFPKPDFVAVVPFPSLWRERPFCGTSAAAPQAAAMAALWWSKYPHWSAAKVRDAMRKSALDLGPAGHDFETGYGLLRAP